MTVTPQERGLPDAPPGLRVTCDGAVYPAEEIARGAAYELFSAHPAPGFQRGRDGARLPWHRFAHASEVTAVHSDLPPAEPPDTPLMAPLHRAQSWAAVHRLSQSPEHAEHRTLAAIRRSATVRPGTRMFKVLSPRQLAGYLRGWLPHGFCYRQYDVAHLRFPADLALLRTDPDGSDDVGEVAFALRWPAIDPVDYATPIGAEHRGLVDIPPHDRVGAPVLGTGFTPSQRHIIPEFITRDFADLPLPANSALLAYTSDGAEVVLYTYQPEQRGWLRMVGPQWRHLLAGVPDLAPDQEYVATGEAGRSTRLVGIHQGREREAVADPPGEFRVLAANRSARMPVSRPRRLLRYATWRGARCLLLGLEAGWARLRLCRPGPESVAALGARCYERGVYETWAPAGELTDERTVEVTYPG